MAIAFHERTPNTLIDTELIFNPHYLHFPGTVAGPAADAVSWLSQPAGPPCCWEVGQAASTLSESGTWPT